jgi:hypothetical protein
MDRAAISPASESKQVYVTIDGREQKNVKYCGNTTYA